MIGLCIGWFNLNSSLCEIYQIEFYLNSELETAEYDKMNSLNLYK